MTVARRKPLTQKLQDTAALLLTLGELTLVVFLIGAAYRLYVLFGPQTPTP